MAMIEHDENLITMLRRIIHRWTAEPEPEPVNWQNVVESLPPIPGVTEQEQQKLDRHNALRQFANETNYKISDAIGTNYHEVKVFGLLMELAEKVDSL